MRQAGVAIRSDQIGRLITIVTDHEAEVHGAFGRWHGASALGEQSTDTVGAAGQRAPLVGLGHRAQRDLPHDVLGPSPSNTVARHGRRRTGDVDPLAGQHTRQPTTARTATPQLDVTTIESGLGHDRPGQRSRIGEQCDPVGHRTPSHRLST